MSYFLDELAFIPADKQVLLDSILNENEFISARLFIYLNELYEDDTDCWIEFKNYAYMDLNHTNMDGEELYAFFIPNRVENKQKWYLTEFKTEAEIEKLALIKEPVTPLQETPIKKESLVNKQYITPVVEKEKSDWIEVDPFMRNILEEYRKTHCPSELRDGFVFSRLVNQLVMEEDNPYCINDDEQLLDDIFVDALYDLGMDGIAIVVNDKIVRSLTHLRSIIDSDRYISSIEIFLIQSKFKQDFKLLEVQSFISGIRQFFAKETKRKINDKVRHWLEIKDFLVNNTTLCRDMSYILIRPFYAAYGEWTNSSEILGEFSLLQEDIEQKENGLYKVSKPVFISREKINKMYSRQSKNFAPEIKVENQLMLSNSHNVQGLAVKLNALDLMKILIDTETDLMRKDLFEENIRDYQGDTNVNNAIQKTIKEDPSSFLLRNNGITILVDKIDYTLGKIKIHNPQIVNGCQTCSVIYNSYQDGIDISQVEIFARVISTEDSQVITNIVSSNNNQNFVTDMIYEITKPYHKQLEEYFKLHKETQAYKQIFYERRSKSLRNEPIKSYQRCTFRNLIQSAITIWFDKPGFASFGEAKLLDMYKNRIFCDNHNPESYYAAAALFANYERLIVDGLLDASYRKCRAQICFLLKYQICNSNVELNDVEKAHQLCVSIFDLLDNETLFQKEVNKALNMFESAKQKWIQDNGIEHEGDIYSTEDFHKYLITACEDKPVENLELDDHPILYSGSIYKLGKDKYNSYFCFINKDRSTIFAHSKMSDIDFSQLQTGQVVVYEVELDKNNKETAVRLRLA